MRWQNRVKAGVMLYALLMLAVFALLLQFYLNRQVAAARTNQASSRALTAYLMAEWTRDKAAAAIRTSQQDAEAAAGTENKPKPSEQEASAKSSASEVNGKHSSSSRPEASSSETVSPAAEAAVKSEKSAAEPASSPPAAKTAGQQVFKQGTAAYQLEGDQLTVTVELAEGRTYRYLFALPAEQSD